MSELDPNGQEERRERKTRREDPSLGVQRALMADEDGDRPLHVAVVHGDRELVHRLCRCVKSVGASVDLRNYLSQTPLHVAVLVMNVDLIRLLLAEGANVRHRDRRGNTVLHLSVRCFDEKCLDVLLRHPPCRSVLDSRNYDGYTPLHVAVFEQNVAAIKMLIASGCDVNTQDGKSGRTALMHSVLSKQEDIACLLKKHGACSQKSDYSGINPMNAAMESGNVVLMAVLDEGNEKSHNICDR